MTGSGQFFGGGARARGAAPLSTEERPTRRAGGQRSRSPLSLPCLSVSSAARLTARARVCRLPPQTGALVNTPPAAAVPLLLRSMAAGLGSSCGRHRDSFHPAVLLSLPPCRYTADRRLLRYATVEVCACAYTRQLSWRRQGCGVRAPSRVREVAAEASSTDRLDCQRPLLLHCAFICRKRAAVQLCLDMGELHEPFV